MSGRELKASEAAALVVLMVEAREVSNPEMRERYGITITGESRKHLTAEKLVESRRGRRGAYFYELTDLGWARLAEGFRTGTLPVPKGSAGAMARALVKGLGGFMVRSGHPLAEIFGPSSDPDMPPEPTPVPPSTAPTLRTADADPGAEIEARIRAAYTELAREPGAWVSLTRLRPLLSDVPRADVDAALRRMNRMPDVNLVPESNQKTLTSRDREAAVTIGDQAKHLLWIGA
ncbi:hypothetical protein [Thermostaphylospora chromogena]|nr:hypothetical protein [Thermostaphylospora chromogena]